MPKVKLDQDYLWNGVIYAAGEEVEVPDSFAVAYNLEFKIQNSEFKVEEQPKNPPKSSRSRKPKAE